MKSFEKPNFNPGGIIDRPDPRDFNFDEFASSFPPFNWEQGFDIEQKLQVVLNNPTFHMPVKDQGDSFSCGGQAESYYGQVLEALQDGSFEERSAKFIYAQTFIPGQGSAMRDNADVAVTQGYGKEALTSSYQNGEAPHESFMERPQDITDFARYDAKGAKAWSYVYVKPDIDTVAQAMSGNSGAIMLIAGSNNGTWASPTPRVPTPSTWKHFMYLGKAYLKEGKKIISALNSWGKDVGKDGWQEFGEEWFTSGNVFAVLTHMYNPTPVTTFEHVFSKTLNYGDVDDEVIFVQKALTITGDFPKTVPYAVRYGDVTRAAVLKFQLREKVASVEDLVKLNGKRVGMFTKAALNKYFA